ncbi:hypothetical protein CEXT_521901 [Caerostris extrusa]|uniref:Uncharacterized protein n=1 Tax=Caerostris extrusa TaxID=172846 RepID=A0AAV4SNB6_CAEEX|nr:hypothetical protein CEXT_521901 [Caerostris extrusa]
MRQVKGAFPILNKFNRNLEPTEKVIHSRDTRCRRRTMLIESLVVRSDSHASRREKQERNHLPNTLLTLAEGQTSCLSPFD